ncbi:MAG: transglycosylase SLT domain-containing protein [Rhodospirillales bacterium]|nr:transglycosylase SLT domain-containing protein [Rhodospirillales bacterium]
MTSSKNSGSRGDLAKTSCLQAAQEVERDTGLPRMLLSAISLVETGKWDRATRANIAWPWTVNARGQSHYYRTKGAAVAAVRRLQDSGIRSIDVGCMQINLRFHADAFSSLEQAFDPDTNVAYAAKFLKKLRKKGLTWNTAIGHYHSRNRVYYLPYRKKVQNLWRAERRRVAQERRATQREAASRLVAVH